MVSKHEHMELHWSGKETPPPSVHTTLTCDKSLSCGEKSENLLIHGDNFPVLSFLRRRFLGKVKCIFIDPPYNTGLQFSHYSDRRGHGSWMSFMRDRLEVLREFLSVEGSIWITIDDHEAHYLKVLCDEIFGRGNFVCDIAWEKRYSPPPKAKELGYVHDHILVYRKTDQFRRNLLPKADSQVGRYKNLDEDPRGPWKQEDYTCRHTAEQRPNLYYPITQPNTGEEIWPDKNRVWAMSPEVHKKNEGDKRIWWGRGGDSRTPYRKKFLSEIKQGMIPTSLWKHTLAGHNQEGKRELLALYGEDIFPTPKPERLIRTVLQIASNPGDFVLDCFAGSGTTGAVAHKMGRKWIMVEISDHIYRVSSRLRKVVEGKDPGGVTEIEKWEGGGGFSFMEAQTTFSILSNFVEKK